MAVAISKNYQSLLLLMFGAVILGVSYYAVMSAPQIARYTGESKTGDALRFGDTVVTVEVVATPESRERGLSGRTGLTEGQGLLFVFDSDGKWGIWMKDMRFAIDIIWINSGWRVVTVMPSVAPDTYPNVFEPTLPARYVLEVPAGFAAKNNIYEGQLVKLVPANKP